MAVAFDGEADVAAAVQEGVGGDLGDEQRDGVAVAGPALDVAGVGGLPADAGDALRQARDD